MTPPKQNLARAELFIDGEFAGNVTEWKFGPPPIIGPPGIRFRNSDVAGRTTKFRYSKYRDPPPKPPPPQIEVVR